MNSTDALRIIDANCNRAREAMRVVEDYVRFVHNDRFLAQECKQLRHDLWQCLESIGTSSLAGVRDAAGDVGRTLSVATEYERCDPAHVAFANLSRLEQALRSLEEFSKCVSPQVALDVERIRYRSYGLHQAVEKLIKVLHRLAEKRLYVLVDGGGSQDAFERRASDLIQHGAQILQLREKSLSDAELLRRARALRHICRDAGALMVINDRPDLAVIAEADGVHVGQDDLPAAAARRIVGPDRLVGVSTHNLEQARRAVLDGADYLGCGPTFHSTTKSFDSFPGPDFLKSVADEISTPAYAIGGIDVRNLDAVMAAGFTRIAVAGTAKSLESLDQLSARLADGDTTMPQQTRLSSGASSSYDG